MIVIAQTAALGRWEEFKLHVRAALRSGDLTPGRLEGDPAADRGLLRRADREHRVPRGARGDRLAIARREGEEALEEPVEVHLRERHALVDQHALHRLDHRRRPGEVVVELRPALADELAHVLVHESRRAPSSRRRARTARSSRLSVSPNPGSAASSLARRTRRAACARRRRRRCGAAGERGSRTAPRATERIGARPEPPRDADEVARAVLAQERHPVGAVERDRARRPARGRRASRCRRRPARAAR